MLEHIRGPKRSSLAVNLLSFLQENLPVRTRGVARLFLEIARHLAQLPRSKGFFGQFRRVMLLFAALVPFQA